VPFVTRPDLLVIPEIHLLGERSELLDDQLLPVLVEMAVTQHDERTFRSLHRASIPTV
jgi:hypothetical protein